ncbi:CPBP family intramembrane metalloprotease [Psychromarinibacter sp. C21-152]|uniref:CPBP family intramembrane metalloprotease n=1 Tax=Psychromarinibacter sediminicola TaxID=3033385 RepID=A0AAE3NUJ9_9RHOB|nr:CPBP family intramembrane glutamic endopeptidase [Psychromarinibacter sediminicola]MDF0602556.1 CPBP family intramembrane metalloprotease [Psychromarinibacter sediminicola]
MQILTLIPEAGTYGVAILAALSLGSFNIAAHIAARWGGDATAALPSVCVAVNAAIIAFGALIVPAGALFPPDAVRSAVALGAGAAAGWAAFRLDLALGRRWRQRPAPRRAPAAEEPRIRAIRARPLPTRGGRAAVARRGGSVTRFGEAGRGARFRLWHLIVLAAEEEVIFRGFLVTLALSLPHPALNVAALIVTTAAFCVSHLTYGWRHAAGKVPLAVLALGLVLATGTVLGAVAVHVVFNLLVFRSNGFAIRMPQPAAVRR